MENKKEGILKQFWNKLKNFWNKLKNFWSNLGIDVVDYKFTDDGFQEEIDKRGMDNEQYEALQANSAERCAARCAENVLQPPAGRARRLDLSNALINKPIARKNEIKAKDIDDNVIE